MDPKRATESLPRVTRKRNTTATDRMTYANRHARERGATLHRGGLLRYMDVPCNPSGVLRIMR